MSYSEGVVRQLGHPSGMVGRLLLRWLNFVNRGMNRTVLQALELEEGDRVLEIGFGGGALLSAVVAQHKASLVAGADISHLALETAEKKFGREIAEGRASFQKCGDAQLPFDDGVFSKVCCVNVIYFWSDAPAMIAEVFRVLSPGGRFVLCYAEGSPDKVSKFPSDLVEGWLHEAGFADVQTSQGHDRENGTYHCTVAFKP